MGKKNRRKTKKEKILKTREERENEMLLIKEKLSTLGLNVGMEGIDLFYEKMADFVETGLSWSGRIKIPGTKRILDIILTSNKQKESLAALLYNKNI